MKIKFFYWCGILGLLTTPSHSNSVNVFVAGGPNYSHLHHQNQVQMNEDVINAYQPYKQSNWNGFWGVGANYSFIPKDYSYTPLSLGVGGYFFHLGQVKGVEQPFINEGLFDALRYQFQAKSATTFAEAQVAYTAYKLSPFALLGLGSSWNRLSNYAEFAAEPDLSAAPGFLFKDHTKQQFAYELGAGVQYLVLQNLKNSFQGTASIGYRYFHLGRGALGKSLEQTSGDVLKIKNLSTQGVVFSFIFSV